MKKRKQNLKNFALSCLFLFLTVFATNAQEEKLRLEILNGHSGGGVLSVAVSNDGKFALTGSTDQTALLWDLATGKQLRRFVGHEDAVSCVQFSKDGRFVLTASYDGSAQLWETATGKRVRGFGENRGGVLVKHSGKILSCAISADMKLVATAGEDKTARIWDFDSGKQLFELRHAGQVNSIAFSPDSRYLLSGGVDKIARLYSTQTGKEERRFVGHTKAIGDVTYSPDGNQVLTNAWDEAVLLWDAKAGSRIKTINVDSNYGIYDISFITNKEILVIQGNGTSSQTVARILNINSNKENWNKTIWGKWFPVITQEGKQLFYRNEFWTCFSIFDIEKDEKKQDLIGKSAPLHDVSVSPNFRFLVATAGEFTSVVWNLEKGNVLPWWRQLPDAPESFRNCFFSPDNKFFVCSVFNSIFLFDADSHKLLQEIPNFGEPSSSDNSLTSAFSNDGNLLLSIGNGKSQLWQLSRFDDTKKPKLIKEFYVDFGFPGRGTSIRGVVFLDNARSFAVASTSGEDTILQIWDTESEKLKHSIKGINFGEAISFSPNGKTIATALGGEIDITKIGIGHAAKATSIQLWDVETGKEIERFGGEFKISANKFAGFKSVAYSKDGKYIAAGSFDGKVYLRDNETKTLEKFEGHTDAVNSVKFAEDAKGNLLVVSGSSDSTTRIWNAATGEEICALVTFRDGNWAVVQTATGRYDAPNGGEIEGIQWVYGNEIIELKQLSAMYYTPNLLPRLLGYNKDPLPPVVALKDIKLYPQVVEQKFDEKTGKLNIKLKARNGGIGATEVYVKSRITDKLGNTTETEKLVVADARDERLKQNPNVVNGEIVSLTVDLPASSFVKGLESEIKIKTSNYLKEIGKGNIQSRSVAISIKPKGEEDFAFPSLYAIVGGVSDYAGEQLDLRFAAKDAEDFSNALNLGARRLFCDKSKPNCLDKVQITTLSTSGKEGTIQPTKENFKRAFADIAAKAKPEDIVVVYLAGHGVSFGAGTDTYFYLTQEARSASREDLTKTFETAAISSEELTDWLTQKEWSAGQKGIKPLKQVLILDTCASGNAAEKLTLSAKRDLSGDQIRAIEFLKDKTGTFVLMGSTADAPSYEASQFGQGLLTYSLLQAMKGAALDRGEYVDVQQLFSYAQREVPRLAENIGGVQKPIVSAPLGKTFVIGQMTDAEKRDLVLPQPKPLMLRPLLTSPPINNDPLKLISELRKRFDAESSYEVVRQRGGKEPQLIYIDDDNFPGGVRVTGTYTVENGNVKIKAYLVRDETVLAELKEIVSTKEKVSDELLNAVRAELGKIPK